MNKHGVKFSAEEQSAMDKGYTEAQRISETGYVWQTGNIRWPQAVSAEHAKKLWFSNFGDESPEPVKMNGHYHLL